MGTESRPKIRVIALTTAGASLARDICGKLEGAECWLPSRLAADAPDARAFERLSQSVEEAFRLQQDLVCIMAVGIVTRAIASQLKGKSVDPAVVALDEKGQFVVSLLSGHLGGANELARQVASLTGGKAVITTATDIHGLPAFDLLAREKGLVIENLSTVKDIHMALLEGRTVRLMDGDGWLREAVAHYPDVCIEAVALQEAMALPGPAVYVGCLEREWPQGWLLLRPRELVAGVGCNRGTSAKEIVGLIRDTFVQEGLSLNSLISLATIEAKRDELGLQEAARLLGVALTCFSAEALKEIPVPHPSEMVAQHMGVVSVCEASAMLAAKTDRLMIPKRKTKNVTLAVARAKSPS